MEGSITQLGLSNYLINKNSPKHSFFKHGYKNYQNFVRDTRRLNFRSTADFGQTVVFRLDEDGRYGDLISNITLEIDMPDISGLSTTPLTTSGYCNGVGNALIKRCEFRIDSNLIDGQSPMWRDIYSQLTIKAGMQENYKKLIKKFDSFNATSFQGGKLYCPLLFWFCQNSTEYDMSSFILPLLTIMNNTIELIVEFETFNNVVVTTDPTATINERKSLGTVNLLIDYVILEEPDRLAYLTRPQAMYLMTQTQEQYFSIDANTKNQTFSLRNIIYPVIELFFIVRLNDSLNSKNYFNYSDSLTLFSRDSPIVKATLTFDGRDKFRDLHTSYFTYLEPSKVHANNFDNFIHCYSFALQPENGPQPSGVCNFSELHDPQLQLEFIDGLGAATLHVFALNYNVLIINKGAAAYLLHNLSKSVPSRLPKDLNAC